MFTIPAICIFFMSRPVITITGLNRKSFVLKTVIEGFVSPKGSFLWLGPLEPLLDHSHSINYCPLLGRRKNLLFVQGNY